MKTPDGVKTMGRDVTVREMIELVEKDRPYYYRSGGGMTLSGGECLCQPQFARDLLRGESIPPLRAWHVFPGKILRWFCPIWILT